MIQHPFCSYKNWAWEGKYWLMALLIAGPDGAQFWSVYFLRSYPGAAGSLGKVLCQCGWASQRPVRRILGGMRPEQNGWKGLRSKSCDLKVERSLGQALGGCVRVMAWEKAESGSPPSNWRQIPSSHLGDSETCESYWRSGRGMIERISTPSLFHF